MTAVQKHVSKWKVVSSVLRGAAVCGEYGARTYKTTLKRYGLRQPESVLVSETKTNDHRRVYSKYYTTSDSKYRKLYAEIAKIIDLQITRICILVYIATTVFNSVPSRD